VTQTAVNARERKRARAAWRKSLRQVITGLHTAERPRVFELCAWALRQAARYSAGRSDALCAMSQLLLTDPMSAA
jgi:hypothetical protein